MIDESQKYPSDKQKYDKNYLRVFGEVCKRCGGTGLEPLSSEHCKTCNGLGYVEKGKQ